MFLKGSGLSCLSGTLSVYIVLLRGTESSEWTNGESVAESTKFSDGIATINEIGPSNRESLSTLVTNIEIEILKPSQL